MTTDPEPVSRQIGRLIETMPVISDTGKWIAPENLPHLFDPVFTTKPVGQDAGLRLSVSGSIVEKHHRKCEVHREPGKDSSFRVWLPVQQAGMVVQT